MTNSHRLAVAVLCIGVCPHLIAQSTLKGAFKDTFRMGAAVNRAHIVGDDQQGVAIVYAQFDSITPENILKWERVHPRPDTYDFADSDKFVAFGEKNRMFIVGHTLVWHNQTPKWVFEDDKGNAVSRDSLLARMKDHIYTVVGRYKGRIHGWDVVNEALDEDGSLRQSPWMKIIGEDYIQKAFEYAHEADPQAELYYNDYSLENAPKRKGAIALIEKLRAKGILVHAVGLQGHDDLEWPSVKDQDETIAACKSLGVKVNITELDITVLPRAFKLNTAEVTATTAAKASLDPYTNGLPDVVQQALAKRYADLFAVFLEHRDAIDRITFWGVTDADSWLNGWPIAGRTDYPLLFDRQGKPKPAFGAVVQTTGKH